MLLRITGKHFQITEALKNYVKRKTAKLPHYYDCINQIDMLVAGDEGGGRSSVEIVARAEHNKVFVAKKAGPDVYACIDATVSRLEKQLHRRKDKERDDKHRI